MYEIVVQCKKDNFSCSLWRKRTDIRTTTPPTTVWLCAQHCRRARSYPRCTKRLSLQPLIFSDRRRKSQFLVAVAVQPVSICGVWAHGAPAGCVRQERVRGRTSGSRWGDANFSADYIGADEYDDDSVGGGGQDQKEALQEEARCKGDGGGGGALPEGRHLHGQGYVQAPEADDV